MELRPNFRIVEGTRPAPQTRRNPIYRGQKVKTATHTNGFQRELCMQLNMPGALTSKLSTLTGRQARAG